MRQGTFIGPIIIAIGLVVAAISFALVGAILKSADGTTELRVERLEAEIQQFRGELAETREQLRRSQSDTKRILDDMARIGSNPSVVPAPVTPRNDQQEAGDHPEVEEMTEVMKLAKSRFNIGISQPNNRVM